MKRRIFLCYLLIFGMVMPVRAEPVKWVDFDVPYESLKYAMEQDIATFEEEKHISWIEALALAACRSGGKCGLSSVKKAVSDLRRPLLNSAKSRIRSASFSHRSITL